MTAAESVPDEADLEEESGVGGDADFDKQTDTNDDGGTEVEPAPVFVLNGPNLGRLGRRQPEIYGSTTHAELVTLCVQAGQELGLAVQVRQSDSEAELIGWLGEAADGAIPVIINPGALAHTSIALRDAAAARTAPLIELHISNVHAREEFRHHSYLSGVASAVMAGLGVEGYVLALSWISVKLG